MKGNKDKKVNGSFVGTPLYVAPEMLERNESGTFTDFWAVGCIIYEMLTGRSPFKHKVGNVPFSDVLERHIDFPSNMSPDAKDLIDKLVQIDPYSRLGVQDISKLKAHPFFAGINWDSIRDQLEQVPAIDDVGCGEEHNEFINEHIDENHDDLQEDEN